MRVATFLPFQPLNIPGVVKSGAITPGVGSWAKWTVHVRGPSVFLVSAPGWRPGAQPEGTARQVFEIPRSHCHLQWEFDVADKLEDVVKWSPADVAAQGQGSGGGVTVMQPNRMVSAALGTHAPAPIAIDAPSATNQKPEQPQATTPAAGTTPDVEDSPSTPAAATAPITKRRP